jgi:hypothetical protein
MKKQTAVEWLVEHLVDVGLDYVLGQHTDLIVQAKAMDKEQKEHAYFSGSADNFNDEGDFKKYYNETYKESEK